MPPCGPCGRHRAEGGPGRTIRWTAAPPTHQGSPCPANGRCRVQGPHALAKQGILHGDPHCGQGPGKRVKGPRNPDWCPARGAPRSGQHTPRGTGRSTPGLLPSNGRAHASTQNAGQVVHESPGFRRPGHLSARPPAGSSQSRAEGPSVGRGAARPVRLAPGAGAAAGSGPVPRREVPPSQQQPPPPLKEGPGQVDEFKGSSRA